MKTNKKHFQVFKKACVKWLDFFGLKDWSVHYGHKYDDENMASIVYNLTGKVATIYLTIDWDIEPTKRAVERTAFHEVCELMLARLVICSRSRFITNDEIVEATHSIIRRLENTVFDKQTRG